jgi:hypothetical protein
VTSASNLTEPLLRVWRTAVESGDLLNEFDAFTDDPGGQWRKGDRLRCGLIRGGYSAANLTTGKPITYEVKERPVGPYFVQVNPYRLLKPMPGIGSGCRFYCHDRSEPLSIWNRKVLLTIPLRHRRWNAFGNAMPFDTDLHALLVRTGYEHQPQLLDRESVEDMLELAAQTPGLLLFYSSVGAGASVDHLHWHIVHHGPVKFAIENESAAFGDAGTIWETVDRLQQAAPRIAFNLLVVGGRAVVVPRTVEKATAGLPGMVISSFELIGKFIVTSDEAYAAATAESLTQALRSVCARTLPVQVAPKTTRNP